MLETKMSIHMDFNDTANFNNIKNWFTCNKELDSNMVIRIIAILVCYTWLLHVTNAIWDEEKLTGLKYLCASGQNMICILSYKGCLNLAGE